MVRGLRRQARAAAFSSSTSIEGYRVPSDAIALANLDTLSTANDRDRAALGCYALAMQHVEILAGDPHFRWLDRVLLDLHFECCSFQQDRAPGLWRTGPVHVTRPAGAPSYQAPDAPGRALDRAMGRVPALCPSYAGGGGDSQVSSAQGLAVHCDASRLRLVSWSCIQQRVCDLVWRAPATAGRSADCVFVADDCAIACGLARYWQVPEKAVMWQRSTSTDEAPRTDDPPLPAERSEPVCDRCFSEAVIVAFGAAR